MKHQKKRKRLDWQWGHPFVFGVVIVRLLTAVSILIWPLWGTIASIIADYFDCFFLMQKMGYTRKMYHILDKNLDWACYITEIIVSLRSPWWPLLSVLILWRLLGHALFLHSEKQWVFLVFGNYFEHAFIWLVAVPMTGLFSGLSPDTYWLIFWILMVAKVVQEAWLHMIWPSYLKSYGFPHIVKACGYHNVGYT